MPTAGCPKCEGTGSGHDLGCPHYNERGKPARVSFDPFTQPCSRCGKIHPLSQCTFIKPNTFEADLEAIKNLSQGGKGQLADHQSEFRKGLRGRDTGSSFEYELGKRVHDALLYLYEVEVDVDEAHSAVPDRTLHPPGTDFEPLTCNEDKLGDPSRNPFRAASTTQSFPN